MSNPGPYPNLNSFLEVLRANGFAVGLDLRLGIAQAFATWQGNFSPNRLRTLLCPVMATNREQQILFYKLFDQHFPHFSSGLYGEAVDEKQREPDPRAADEARAQTRRIWIGIAVFMTVVLIILAVWNRTWIRKPAPTSSTSAPGTAPDEQKSTHTRVGTKPVERPRFSEPPLTIMPLSRPGQPGRGWRWLTILLFPLPLWAGAEAWAWYRRRAILERAANRGDDSFPSQPLTLPLRASPSAGLAATLRSLRRPISGPLRLDLAGTISATNRAAGFPVFCYAPVFRRAQYLVLIDRASPRDHQAKLFEELAAALDRRGVRVTAYSFAGDPRVCRSLKTGRSIYLADLLQRTDDHRLILFGEGHNLVSDWGAVTPAGSILLRWQQRAILTPRVPKEWNQREFLLARYFLLLPATTQALAASVDYFDPDRVAQVRRPASEFDARSLDLDHATVEEIRNYLGDEKLYTWLCACALYPQLQWGLTLHLGSIIDPGLLTEINLEKLVRLPWFRRGSIPVQLQDELAKSLDEITRLRLRSVILELLEPSRTLSTGAPANDHRLEIAVQRLDLLPEERREIQEDETVARVVAEQDIPQQAFLASPALRKALFPYGLPALGLRWPLRRAIIAFSVLLLASVAALAWYSEKHPPMETVQVRIHLHIVHLVLESRSFDQMLGFLYESRKKSPTGQPFEGLTGDETNPDDTGRKVRVFKIDSKTPHPYLMPGADPGEGFFNTNYQLFSTDDPARRATPTNTDNLAGPIPTNQGFVINFKAAIASDQAQHYKDTLPGTDPSQIMGMYAPEMLPILSGLAKGFAVCDQWFASAPTETIPNRAFIHAATSQGHLDNHVEVFTGPSIFGRLSEKKIDWAIYGYNRDPLTRLDYPDTQKADESHFGHFRDFQAAAAAGALPAYTFLEPDFGAGGNSQHPNYDVSLGEKFIHDVYYAVRNGRDWKDTLLIITYSNHGGNYDHVPPPWGAVPPDDSVGEWNFDFTRFGVRVPAVLISPRIAAGTVFRAKIGTIDHTSVLKTIERLWNLSPLTARDKAAPDLLGVLTLATPRTDDPLFEVNVPVSSPPPPNPPKLPISRKK